MSENIPSQLIPPQVNYKQSESFPVKYRFRKVPLFNIQTPIIVAPTATQQLQFKLSADVFNLSRSFLQYKCSAPATAATNIWVAQDCPELINQIQLTDGGSLPVTTINYAQKYARLFNKLGTKVRDYLDNDPQVCLCPSNSIVSALPAVYPVADNRGAQTFSTGACSANVNYLENQYLMSSGINTALNWSRQVPLNCYKESIFSLDKDQYFGRDMFINVLAGPGTQMAFQSASAVDPTNTPAAMAQNITIQAMYLWLAVEVNQVISASIKQKYMSGGIKMLMPFPYMTVLPSAAAASTANLTWIIQPSQGMKIQKFLWQPYHGNQQSNTFFDSSNYNGNKVSNYQTSIDTNPLTDTFLDCRLAVNDTSGNIYSDDYRENEQYCRDRVVGLNQSVYQMNWFHENSWVNTYDSSLVPNENLDEGLDLNQARTWGVQANLGTGIGGAGVPALVHYVYCIVLRELSVDPLSGILFDAGKNRINPVPAPATQ